MAEDTKDQELEEQPAAAAPKPYVTITLNDEGKLEISSNCAGWACKGLIVEAYQSVTK